MDVLFQRFRNVVARMARNTGSDNAVITEHNVYQEGNPRNKPLMQQILRELMLPGSRIDGLEHLAEFSRRSAAGESCLILMEHYSNFDIPCFYELLEAEGETGRQIAGRIVSIAGTKLNEENSFVRAFTEIFTRVVIIPRTNLEGMDDPDRRREEAERRGKINAVALKTLLRLRRSGRIILVFPTGTRYRPWDPSTGRGQREVDSYMRNYRNMLLVAVNGNILLPHPDGMDSDMAVRDLMLYTAGPVYECREYRARALDAWPGGPENDPRQHVVDTLMAELRAMHARAEERRRTLLARTAEGA